MLVQPCFIARYTIALFQGKLQLRIKDQHRFESWFTIALYHGAPMLVSKCTITLSRCATILYRGKIDTYRVPCTRITCFYDIIRVAQNWCELEPFAKIKIRRP